jgi:hypothetical protein
MATNADSFPITAAMLTPAWVKPTVTFYTAAGKANASDAYLPATLAEKAGARGGTNAAVSTDPNYTFASTIDVDQERKPYPNTISTVAAVECDQTMSISNIET